MNFLIVGPGAMGCLFAARLKRAGHNVSLLDYIEERADIVDSRGILVEGVSGEYRVKVPVMSGKITQAPDFVLLCVKSYSTREAAETIKPWLDPNTLIVTLQNGIGNLEILEDAFGASRVFGGVTAEGATLLGRGKIRHAGQGETIIGPSEGPDSPAEKIVSAFSQAGFQVSSSARVYDLLWGKLIINVGINALTALTRLRNGRISELDGTQQIMTEAVREAVAVAEAKHIQLPYPDPVGRVREVCRDTAENIASMLQDVLKEKTTEIEAINGAVIREGEALGIPTPVNRTLTSLVQVLQMTYEERL